MSLRVTNLRLPVEVPEADLPEHIADRLCVAVDEVTSWRILRKSLDARQRTSLQFVYTVQVDLPSETEAWLSKQSIREVDAFQHRSFEDPAAGSQALEDRPVIVGSGPAGILAAHYLALRGYRPLVLERGAAVKERVPAIRRFDSGQAFEQENNYLFGEGGAGTFSDGKLTCRLSGPDIDWVLEQFVECGGKPSIIYENRPHLGSNRLPMLVRNFRRKIEALGGEYRFQCRFEGLDVVDGKIRGIDTSSGYISASQVVLGIGHSARDTYERLYESGVPMEAKAFQLGLRIEQPQDAINTQKYGRPEYLHILGAADYTLQAKAQRDVYTFCMCAGGHIIPSISEPGMFCTNGMSNSRHDTPFANSGLMVTLQPSDFDSDHALAGVELQRQFEAVAYKMGRGEYFSPIQLATDFMANRSQSSSSTMVCSYKRGVVEGDLSRVLPQLVLRSLQQGLPILDRKWNGNFMKDATLVGPEMRGSSPVRIIRDRESMQSPGFDGLYPVGEGAGFAGGIISAAVDGLIAAKKIVETFAPLNT